MILSQHGVSLYVELPTIFLAAVFGAAYFSTRHVSAVAVIGVGLIIGLGGGIWRDIVLNIEPAAFQYWYFVPVALAGALVGSILRDRYDAQWIVRHLRNVVTALLLVIGLEKAYNYDNPVISVMLIGLITAVGGTVSVSLLMKHDLFHHNGGPYLMLCLFVASVVFLVVSITRWIVAAEVLTVVVFGILRVVGERRGWTVPELPWESPTAAATPGGDQVSR